MPHSRTEIHGWRRTKWRMNSVLSAKRQADFDSMTLMDVDIDGLQRYVGWTYCLADDPYR